MSGICLHCRLIVSLWKHAETMGAVDGCGIGATQLRVPVQPPVALSCVRQHVHNEICVWHNCLHVASLELHAHLSLALNKLAASLCVATRSQVWCGVLLNDCTAEAAPASWSRSTDSPSQGTRDRHVARAAACLFVVLHPAK
jgi:hypothetical protein